MFKDLGPCFGMNGHSRRDTDVISRLSKSTTEDLSFYIGFAMELMVNMVVLDENFCFCIHFYRNVIIIIFYFDLGVIWGRFRHRKSMFFSIERSKLYKTLNVFLTS